MAAAVDSAPSVASQAECEEDGERSATSGHLPVFDAFEDLGLTGRDVAELSHVTPPTVSKWRKAKVRIPGDKLAFLTLVLAHLLDEVEHMNAVNAKLGIQANEENGAASTLGAIESARAQLTYQDVLNRDLPATEVRTGAQKFRIWWASGAAQKLQDKHFKPSASADVLEILKKMRTKP